MPDFRPERPAAAFLDWLDSWHARLPDVPLSDVVSRAGGADGVAVMIVDLLVGFCCEGALASPRIGALAPKSAAFLRAVHEAGIRSMVLAADSHPPDSPEFQSFPPHCLTGTREADPVPDLTALLFFPEVSVIAKGSINIGLQPELDDWLAENTRVRSWIVLGDCTDLCVYHAAMHLRLRANARGEDLQVWVPADLVDTYDLPVELANSVGALPHAGDLMHLLFLYHMALNGIAVVREIRP